MSLLPVILIETFMILRDMDHVEKRLEVGIPIGWVKELFERNMLELSKSIEPIDEKADVLVAGCLGIEGSSLTNHELARLSNLPVPINEAVVLDSKRDHIHRSGASSYLLLQGSNL
jgi:hypothetical protein